MSGAFNKSVFNGNTVSFEINEENDKHRYVFFGGDMICSFLTIDNIYEYISKMRNNLTLYSIAVGYENFFNSTF